MGYYALPRYMATRIAKTGETSVVMVHAIGRGSTLGSIEGSVRVVSLPDVNGTTTYASPFAFIEYNLFGLFVPFSVAATYEAGVDSLPHVPLNIAEWDDMVQRLALNYGSDGHNEYYGGNVDAAQANLDTTDPPATPSGDGTDETDQAVFNPELGLGPMGVRRVFNHERWISSGTKLDISKIVTVPGAGNFTNKSVNDLVYMDNIDLSVPAGISGPGFFVIACQRYKTAASKGFAASYGKEKSTEVISDADRRTALNEYMNGDMLKIKGMLVDKTSQSGKYLRGMLWEGDTSIEPMTTGTNGIAAQMWPDGQGAVRANDILIGVKYACPMSIPFSIQPDLM